MWSTDVPSSCFSGYVVSLDDDPTVNLTANGTRTISFQMLIDGGFPSCDSQSITVTPIPIETFSGMLLNINSASIEVFGNDQSM